MEKPDSSNWFNVQTLPETYMFSPENRPGQLRFPVCRSIPVIDLGGHHDRDEIVEQIFKASEDFGFFQVINHGVSEKLIDETMSVFKEFHAMPASDKAGECSKDPDKSCKFYTSSENYATEKVHYWRDAMLHPCHPLEQWKQFWPSKPIKYREVVGTYSVEIRKLGFRILDLISEGLGVRPEYFSNGLAENPILMVNHYPPCPDPSLTLGLAKHCDPSLINILLQGDIFGLQIFRDGGWLYVEPVPHAFVVNIGYLFEVISNGKLQGAVHRVVTNSSRFRTTASFHIYPSDDCVVEPAKDLINETHPPLYRAFLCKDFRLNYTSTGGNPQALRQFISLTH